MLSLFQRYLKERESFVPVYRDILADGGSKSPAETLAAALLAEAGYQGDVAFVDPLCGRELLRESRQDAAGNPPGGWLPEQRVTLVQAFDGFTRAAAFAGFAEDRLGTLEPGRMADFVPLSRPRPGASRPAAR